MIEVVEVYGKCCHRITKFSEYLLSCHKKLTDTVCVWV